jgi:hypothetical protein
MSVVETVTVLFTDLVDSTGLLARYRPEVNADLRRDHFVALRVRRDGTNEAARDNFAAAQGIAEERGFGLVARLSAGPVQP